METEINNRGVFCVIIIIFLRLYGRQYFHTTYVRGSFHTTRFVNIAVLNIVQISLYPFNCAIITQASSISCNNLLIMLSYRRDLDGE